MEGRSPGRISDSLPVEGKRNAAFGSLRNADSQTVRTFRRSRRGRPVKKVETTHCTRHCSAPFTVWDGHFSENQGANGSREKKGPVEKTRTRAGATPLFRLPAAQKVFGVAPALRH